MEKLRDSVNMGAVNSKLLAERTENVANLKKQKVDYKDAWAHQKVQSQNRKEMQK